VLALQEWEWLALQEWEWLVPWAWVQAGLLGRAEVIGPAGGGLAIGLAAGGLVIGAVGIFAVEVGLGGA